MYAYATCVSSESVHCLLCLCLCLYVCVCAHRSFVTAEAVRDTDWWTLLGYSLLGFLVGGVAIMLGTHAPMHTMMFFGWR